ncbi:MAG TPA: c-type cytochrome [Bradyrhizobium sp.]|uniref:c-type cytochrome n=1 Tax=Bradyrhizobium sp. TaxID=376 RepID=UPI002D7F7447|nr:c-type cytochrome [Bradyrhizobium sp.]HET7889516.1 c-type cytochrome [Bradyrhizobium sp.]
MKLVFAGALVVMGLAAAAAFAQSAPPAAAPADAAALPGWAYPANPALPEFDAKEEKTLPGSSRKYTQAQVENDFAPPDWFPEDHPPMPSVVANGRTPAVKACSKCHVTTGGGHPESSDLAGLPEAYIVRQMADFKDGHRKGARAGSMFPIAKAVSDEEVREAAKYYAALPRLAWNKVVETDTVPKTELRVGGMRFAIDGTEPIGNRIIELPQAPERAHLRDSRFGFVANVPVGSLKRGEALVKGSAGQTQPCATCHGPDLKGLGEVPHLTGRSPMYVFRQLNDIKIGSRAGANAELMRPVVANLSESDMLAISAYLASLSP